MLVLGLVLILGAAALTVGAVYDGREAASVELLGATVDTTVAGVFFSGAGTMLVFLVGVWLLTASMGRARKKRTERKEARRRQRESVKQLEEERTNLRAENERLAQQLGHNQLDNDTGTVDPATADTGGPGLSDGATPRDDGTRTTAPVRESDGPSAPGQGSHARANTDLRSPETTTLRGRDTEHPA
jgi:hypothetical protein